MKGKKCVVTTSNRGVFFGAVERYNMEAGTAILTNARMCVYWPAETHGVLGLASNGPPPGSRVTPSVSRIELNAVDSMTHCTDSAIAAWGKEPWS